MDRHIQKLAGVGKEVPRRWREDNTAVKKIVSTRKETQGKERERGEREREREREKEKERDECKGNRKKRCKHHRKTEKTKVTKEQMNKEQI